MITVYLKIFQLLFGSIVKIVMTLGIIGLVILFVLETGIVDIGVNRPSDTELIRWLLDV